MNEQTKQELKQELLTLSENVTEDVVNSVFRMTEIAIKLSENKIDDALLPALAPAKAYILKQVDKIDGKVG